VKILRPTHPSISTSMARRFGWAPRGERCRAPIPFGHWKTTTFVAGLRVDRIDAPMTIEGALDGEAFLAYVEQVLAPTLSTGDTLVMDNVPLHKVAGVSEAITAKGASVLYLSGLFARLRSHREVLLEVQVDPATHRGAHRRSAGGGGRRSPANRHARRMQELLRRMRL
jgi:DDE superfamily endonuclease